MGGQKWPGRHLHSIQWCFRTQAHQHAGRWTTAFIRWKQDIQVTFFVNLIKLRLQLATETNVDKDQQLAIYDNQLDGFDWTRAVHTKSFHRVSILVVSAHLNSDGFFVRFFAIFFVYISTDFRRNSNTLLLCWWSETSFFEHYHSWHPCTQLLIRFSRGKYSQDCSVGGCVQNLLGDFGAISPFKQNIYSQPATRKWQFHIYGFGLSRCFPVQSHLLLCC